MPARLVRIAILVGSLLVITACSPTPAPSGTPPVASPPASSPPSSGPSTAPSVTALLKVTSEGGFINPAATLNTLPIVEVLSDGRILTAGPVDAIAPGPLLIPVQVRDTGAPGAAAILDAIRQAGLDQPATGGPGIPGDSGTDVFSVTIDGETVETRLAGGGPGLGGPGGPGLGGSQDPGKAAAFALLDRLLDPAETWGGTAAAPTQYAPAGFRVYVIPGAPSSDPATAQQPVVWPLATPLSAFGTQAVPDRGVAGLRQGVVLGADAATLAPIFAAATAVTPFSSGGSTWTLSVRALLPDELGG